MKLVTPIFVSENHIAIIKNNYKTTLFHCFFFISKNIFPCVYFAKLVAPKIGGPRQLPSLPNGRTVPGNVSRNSLGGRRVNI